MQTTRFVRTVLSEDEKQALSHISTEIPAKEIVSSFVSCKGKI
jgi:hypothetical protein